MRNATQHLSNLLCHLFAVILLFLGGLQNGMALATPTTPTTDFTDNGDGTVTHKTTGLMWKRCAEGQTWTGSTCTGTGTIYTWGPANALTPGFAGYSNWRLPTIRELSTITELAATKPGINTAIFPSTPASKFWSKTESFYGQARFVDFSDGSVGAVTESTPYQVRLVRGGQSSGLLDITRPDTDYVDNKDGTVTHTPTTLTWKRCAEGQTWSGSTCSGTATPSTWAAARALTLTFAMQSDWRLPTQMELRSLMDFSPNKSKPSMNTAIFPNAPGSDYFWSISADANNSGRAWSVNSYQGDDAILPKAGGFLVRLVRGGQSVGSLASLTGLSLNCPSPLNAGATGLCSASASYSDGSSTTVSATGWSSSDLTALTVNSSGSLTAGSPTADTPVTISASYSEGAVSQPATYVVTVKALASPGSSASLTGLHLNCPLSLNANAVSSCSSSASYSDNSIKTVNATGWTSDSTVLTVSSSGRLTAGSPTADTTVTISASYSEGAVSKTDSAPVKVKASVTIPTTDFSDNGDGTVTDKTTGLTWKRCTEGQTWAGAACTGTATIYTWAQAMTLTSSFAGNSDWRLPTIAELVTIVDRGAYNPAINGTLFPNTPASSFWSASVYAASLDGAWGVNFGGGYSFSNGRASAFQVRLVRGGQLLGSLNIYTPSSDFSDNGNGTVTHMKTSLIWKRCAEGQAWSGSNCTGTATTSTWAAATALPKNNAYAGYSDWRLPTQNELQTLVEYSIAYPGPTINSVIFPNTPTSSFWSASEDYANSSDHAWLVHFGNGDDLSADKANALQVRLVRGGQSLGPSVHGPDCLFNWAEGYVPASFSPIGSVSQKLNPYYYRYYAKSDSYLASSSDGNAYYLDKNTGLVKLGPLTQWYAKAGCLP